MKEIIQKIISYVDKCLSYILIFFIKIYQYTLSPDKWIPSLRLKWKICCHSPHCSQYSINVLKRYWFIKWIWKAVDRVVHCTWSDHVIYDPEYYKVVFFSSAPIWIPFLKKLYSDKKFDVLEVITMPDKPRWRWQKIYPNIIKVEAKKLWIKVSTPIKLKNNSDFIEHLKSLKPDFFVVIAYWKIISQVLLDIPKIAPINVHWSILPKYRWASPLQSVFLENENETWITIMKMDATMDTWNIIDIKKIKLFFDDNTKTLIEKFQKIWPKFLNSSLWKYWKRILWEEKQDDNFATYCKKIKKADWEVNVFSDSLFSIYSKYKAFYLRPKIYFYTNYDNFKTEWKLVKIEKIIINKEKYDEFKEEPLFIWKRLNSCVETIVLKPEWKKTMDFSSFVAWYWK